MLRTSTAQGFRMKADKDKRHLDRIGMFFGYRIMDGGSLFGIPLNLPFGKYGQQASSSASYNDSLKAAARLPR